jgi:hypothetical protein
MKHARLFLAFLLMVLFGKNISAQGSEQFINEIDGCWYITRWAGGYTGEIINYDPLPRDSVIISRINSYDSIQITQYLPYFTIEKFGVVWSNTFNKWTLSLSGHEVYTELSAKNFKVSLIENITTYSRVDFTDVNLYNAKIDSVADLMQGRWYLTAAGSGDFEIKENPVSGDSIIVSVFPDSDSLMVSYYKDCIPEYSDTFHIAIDSSYSLQTDALMLIGKNEIDRILVAVSDTAMILQTDSIPGHYLVLEPIDTFTFYKAPLILNVTNDSACRTADLALIVMADPGLIRWYASAEGGSPISHGNVFFPTIMETTTFYVDAEFNGCVTPLRTPVIAVLKPVPAFTSVADDSRCGEGQVLLSASSSEGVIHWYTDSMATVSVATGNSFETPVLDITTVYYADVALNGCFSERMPVTATISYNDTCVSYIHPPIDEKIVVFPDPTTGKFQLLFEGINNSGYLKICNASGLLVKELQFEGTVQSVSMDISEYPAGLYFIILKNDSNVRVLKVIKE